ncbi:ABC transporter permease subunit [Amphritea sp. 2_MG-2023]|uniref:ABC transporter permease subunit n=1 Tax=Amphritea TaxID=515417 RepID=UPI001C077781|nr:MULTISPECIES: ABC transporter permease subunit [Amphritea]MBU2967730.1 ABC transporter permease subunit [Amphritea atlantica]MDO6416952.1 ABC transporter permease subunit [Amphritea sp. 2_MG-2023]
MSIENSSVIPDLDFNTPAARRGRKLRALKDKVASVGIGLGGVSVIIAILLIFFYLLYEVIPMFRSAEVQPWVHNDQVVEPYAVPGAGKTLYMAMEEQAEIGIRVTDQGNIIFFSTTSGEVIKSIQASLPVGATITSFAMVSENSRMFALGLSNGQALVFKHTYKSTYPDGKRVILPNIAYPLGEQPIDVASTALEHLTISGSEGSYALIGGNQENLQAIFISQTENMFTGDVELEESTTKLPDLGIKIKKMLLMPDLAWLFVAGESGKMAVVNLRNQDAPVITQVLQASSSKITTFDLLLGGNALLLGNAEGDVSEWFLVRDDQGEWQMTKIRSFDTGNTSVSDLAIEHRRKGFATIDAAGELRLYNTTANVNVLAEKVAQANASMITLAPRANAALIEEGGKLTLLHIDNEHPEVSWSSLWGKVWYEGYEEPKYVWQSSAANNDFEPKFSLMPLAFGTLKAAFYAMILATPLAICGAIYTAYFMVPTLRRKVKPFIELMEALPTVILGFLAGLWLAPFMEENLPGIFVTLLMIPLAVLAFAYAWAQMPKQIRWLVPDGWDALLLIPVIMLATWFSISISPSIELTLFDGNMRHWLTNDLGIAYDQRNAMVIGIAMGFAIIPTIFSITEDAIFAVPKHLSYGSLALGATPWQTLTRVVIPTASPGIFSAVMIGMGRAVGETMIVLMATGNTPIMDANIFEGMRTLAANIAVEMPESEVGSTHYRILFLAAFVLFMFTFAVNTMAEVIRQRLRNKYGSL